MTTNYMADLLSFLKELGANNNREWFNANKDRYTALHKLWLADLDRLISLVKEFDPSIGFLSGKDAAYRIYRDIRFSANKLPYKDYFSAVIGRNGRKCTQSAFYLHIQPGNSALYAGLWVQEGDLLQSVRSLLDAEGDELKAILSSPELNNSFKFSPFYTLKKAPKGYPADHPHIEFIKAKDFTFCHPVPDSFFTSKDWVSKAAAEFKKAKPINDFFNYIFE